MVCGATPGPTSATYPPRGLVDATKVDAIVDEMVAAIPQSNVSTRWMQPTWKQLCRSCSYTICARAFDRDGHFDVINSAKGGKYAKSSQLAKLAENKRFRCSGALLMQIVSSHFIVVPIATWNSYAVALFLQNLLILESYDYIFLKLKMK